MIRTLSPYQPLPFQAILISTNNICHRNSILLCRVRYQFNRSWWLPFSEKILIGLKLEIVYSSLLNINSNNKTWFWKCVLKHIECVAIALCRRILLWSNSGFQNLCSAFGTCWWCVSIYTPLMAHNTRFIIALLLICAFFNSFYW